MVLKAELKSRCRWECQQMNLFFFFFSLSRLRSLCIVQKDERVLRPRCFRCYTAEMGRAASCVSLVAGRHFRLPILRCQSSRTNRFKEDFGFSSWNRTDWLPWFSRKSVGVQCCQLNRHWLNLKQTENWEAHDFKILIWSVWVSSVLTALTRVSTDRPLRRSSFLVITYSSLNLSCLPNAVQFRLGVCPSLEFPVRQWRVIAVFMPV